MLPPITHLRLARPTTDVTAAERFWTAGLGMAVLWRSEPDEPAAMLAVGLAGAGWHLELVADGTAPTPTEEDLLVLYLGGPPAPEDLARLVAAGGRIVAARNPYWDHRGTTVVDPDGYRLVLTHRAWP